MKNYIYLLFAILATLHLVNGQSDQVAKMLDEIDEGNITAAKTYLEKNKDKISGNPDLMYLDAVLTEDGKTAVNKYETYTDKYPKHTYGDAALYNVYCYNFSLGLYKKASEILEKLKSAYPGSKYIRMANLDIPDESAAEDESSTTESYEVPVKETTGDQYKFTVQAGAFSNRGNAEKLKSDLEAANFPAEISEKSVAGTVFNVVTAGKFETREKAGDFLVWLKNNMNLTGRIVDL